MRRLIFAALAANGAFSSAFSPSAFAGLQLTRPAACGVQGAVRPRQAAPGLITVKAQEAAPNDTCEVESGNTEECTASNSFKRKDGKDMTKLEKEQLYLDCCASWNIDGKSILNNEEYEQLKDDLSFDGSMVMLMSREEIQFMVAKNRYNKGQPIMEDREFDALRKKLVSAGSDAVKHQASACKILENGEKECKADLYPDDGKNSILYAPAFFQMGLVFQELAYWMKGWDPLVSIIVTSPFIAATTWFLTKKIYFQDPLVVRGVCPECGTPNTVFFGDILWVSTLGPDPKRPLSPGKYQPQPEVNVKCSSKACGASLRANKDDMKVFSITKM